VQSALRRAVRVYRLSRYRVDAPRAAEANVPAALVLGFGNVTEERILRGVEVLGKTMTDRLASPNLTVDAVAGAALTLQAVATRPTGGTHGQADLRG